MKTPRLFFLLAAVMAAGFLINRARADLEMVAPTPAPDWTLNDVNGKPVKSAQFKGKTVVLDFWATWCAPCRGEIRGYVKLQEKYRDKGLVIVGVSVDQGGPDVVQKFMTDFQVNYPIVMADDKIIHAFGDVEGLPTTFVIDRAGKIRAVKIGAMPTDDFEKVLLPYLK